MAKKPSASPIDLAAFDLEAEAERGAQMELLAPRADKASGAAAAQPLGITFEVLGEESPTFRRNVREMIDEVQANLAAEPKEPDAVDKLARARTAACAVTGWSGVVFEGAEVAFSREAATKLFYDRPWIARQIEAFRSRPGNFGPR